MARAVWRMFSSTNSRRPGVVSADSRARSYWPSTRWPMNPSSRPSWRVVTQRLASVIDALREPAARRQHLVEELALEPADEPGERRRVGPDPAGPVDDGDALHDARQVRARGARARAGTTRAIAAA